MNTRTLSCARLAGPVMALLALAGCERAQHFAATGQEVPATRQVAQYRAPETAPRGVPAWLHMTGPDAAADKVKDAALAATVSATLARDTTMNTTQVDVDNAGGHVLLFGTAPDAAARQRATVVASQVEGVVSVQNHLYVPSSR